jgi:hypothetical protein
MQGSRPTVLPGRGRSGPGDRLVVVTDATLSGMSPATSPSGLGRLVNILFHIEKKGPRAIQSTAICTAIRLYAA